MTGCLLEAGDDEVGKFAASLLAVLVEPTIVVFLSVVVVESGAIEDCESFDCR